MQYIKIYNILYTNKYSKKLYLNYRERFINFRFFKKRINKLLIMSLYGGMPFLPALPASECHWCNSRDPND